MQSDDWRLQWVKQKCELALQLASGMQGAGYGEAALIICSVLSAIAAEVWPGVRGTDRSRFCELLIRYSAPSCGAGTVSVPLLIQFLLKHDRDSEARKLQSFVHNRESPRVVTGGEVDASENRIIQACPELSVSDVRNFSYASILYREVRSSYAHEYGPGARSSQWPMTTAEGPQVSYVNRLTDEGGQSVQTRLIHFHAEWLAALALSVAENLCGKVVPERPPGVWWIAGS